MTKEEAKKNAEVMLAYSEGRVVQFRISGGHNWQEANDLAFQFINCEYRIKPTPKLRPWRPEEVPVGAWFKQVGSKQWDQALTYYLSGDTAYLKFYSISSYDCNCSELHRLYEHSLDHGLTWLPCGVPE